MNRKIATTLLVIALLGLTSCAPLDYTDQDSFGASCLNSKVQQSPISIESQLCKNMPIFDFELFDTTGQFEYDQTIHNFKYTTSSKLGTLNVVDVDEFEKKYTATYIQFKAPAEHIIHDLQADMDIQIYFTSEKENEKDAIFSFQLYKSSSVHNMVRDKYTVNWFKDLDYGTGNDQTMHLEELSKRVNTVPHYYRYAGTTTVPGCYDVIWYVYTSPIYVDEAVINTFKAALAGLPPADIVLKDGGNARDPIVVDEDVLIERFCYREYWRNHMPFNYGMWFTLGLLTLYLIMQLCSNGQVPIRDHDYTESGWTAHPLISLKVVSNEIFTRRIRFTILWMNLFNSAIIVAIFSANDRQMTDDNEVTGAEIFLYGLAGSLLGGIFTYIWGFFVRKYYINKYYAFEAKGDTVKVDHYLDNAEYYLYTFYFITFIWLWGGGWIFIWQMNYINPIDKVNVIGTSNADRSLLWLASYGISIGLDWFFFDLILAAFACKIGILRRLLKWKGYVYDDYCHKTYLMFTKED